MASLAELAQAKWQSSGLTDEQARKLKLRAVPGETLPSMAPNFFKAGALVIPYWTPDGKPSNFYRIRYLEPLSGWEGMAEKPQRYAQPRGTLNEVYMPPLLERPWAAVLADPEVTLYITEGELKSAAACAVGLPCLGLGGVDVWRSGRRGMELLPTLASTVWQGRRVVIVFDSDAASNPNVVRAQRDLAKELLNRGALPAIASLPPAATGEKQGLDDFLVNNGPDALADLLEDAPAFAESEALWGMNEEVVYVREPGIIVVRDTMQQMTPANFVTHAYANRHYLEIVQNRHGVTTQRRSLPKRWMEWEQRFELQRITYAPGQPRIYNNQLNMWEGWGVTPAKGDVGPWKKLLDHLFRLEKPEARKWFEQWLAYPIQHPGTKLYCSVVVWGAVHGTGKSLVGYTMRDIYGKNSTSINDESLHSSFNEWAQNKQFVLGEEVTGGNQRAAADRLKSTITQEDLRINVKYLPSYVVPDCVNYYLTSNHPDAFFLEDTDRRNFVVEVVGQPLPLQFYQEYDRWRREGGAAALMYHLLRVDLEGFYPKAPALATHSKLSMIVDNKSDIASWVLTLREDPVSALRPLGERAAEEAQLVTAAQLLRCYDPEGKGRVTANGLAKELKRSGFRQVNHGLPVKTEAGVQRLWAIRNNDYWQKQTPKTCAQHFDSVFGPQAKKF